MMNHRLVFTLALASLSSPAHAETAAPATQPASAASPAPETVKLEVGSPAPALAPAKWLQGEPVNAFENDKTYLIELWATWCGPCLAAIPHINELHHQFKDKGLVAIGVNVQEDDIAKPSEFLKRKSDGMAYRVAFDGPQGSTMKNWMRAAGVSGIPHTFIVHQGKLLWHGHPSALDAAMVASMIDGKFNSALGEQANTARQALQKKIYESMNEVSALTNAKKFDEAMAKLDASDQQAGPEWDDIIGLAKGRILTAKGDPGAARFFIELANNSPDNGKVQFYTVDKLLNAPELKDQRDPKAAKVCIGRLLASSPGAPKLLFVDAQGIVGVGVNELLFVDAHADYALGDKASAEKTLAALAALPDSTDKGFMPRL